MHVLEPKDIASRNNKHAKVKRRSSRISLLLLVVLLAVGGGAYWYTYLRKKPASLATTPVTPQLSSNKSVASAAKPAKTTLKTFTGVEFKDLYHSIKYPNTEPFTTPPEITGNVVADTRIRELADKRGFLLTSIPVAPIVKTNEPLLKGEEDDLLQPLALNSWLQLKAAAKKDGLSMTLISAYRSPKWQRQLFTQRLYATGVTAAQIASGTADNAVNATLGLTAVPGYSRHHTGYTVDLYCEDGTAFVSSSCNTWISKDNYANAKKYGWIPSYPPGAGEQGPEPEPWEYVWVGTDVLYK